LFNHGYKLEVLGVLEWKRIVMTQQPVSYHALRITPRTSNQLKSIINQ